MPHDRHGPRAADEHRRRSGRDGDQGGAQVGLQGQGHARGPGARSSSPPATSPAARPRSSASPPRRSTATASARSRRASSTVPFGDAAALEAAITPRHGRLPRRADPGRGRHRRAAGRLPARGARDLHAPQRAADLRRGADRPRPHRPRCSPATTKASGPTASSLGKALGGGLLPVSGVPRDART